MRLIILRKKLEEGATINSIIGGARRGLVVADRGWKPMAKRSEGREGNSKRIRS